MLRPATWQLIRPKSVPPLTGVTMGTVVDTPVATWNGSWSPGSAMVAELSAGAPIVGVDAFAFLPPEAGAILAEGDKLRRLDDATNWEAQNVSPFPTRTIVALRRATEKVTTGA